MNTQYITSTVYPGLRAMPNTLMPAAISTTSITKTVTATVTTTITQVITATERFSVKAGSSVDPFNSLVYNASVAVADKFGLAPLNLEQYMPYTKKLVAALVLGSTAGSAYLYGCYHTGQVPRPEIEEDQLQKDLNDALESDEAEDQIQQELAAAQEQIPEEQDIAPQEPIPNDQPLPVEEEPPTAHPIKQAAGTIKTPNRTRSRPPTRPKSPLTPLQQEIRDSYKQSIEANTDRLLRKEITSPDLADEIFEKVTGRTPPSAVIKRKRSFLDGGGEVEYSPLMNTSQAQLMDRRDAEEVGLVAASPPGKVDFANLPVLAPTEESPSKRARTSSLPALSVNTAGRASASEAAARRSVSPRRSPRKRKTMSLSVNTLSRRSATPRDE